MKEIFKSIIVKIDLIRVATAVTVLAIFAGVTWALINKNIPEGNKEILHNLIGIIEGAVMTVVGYEFGASKGAQKGGDKGDIVQTDKIETPK